MQKISHNEWPEIVFGSSESAQSQAIRRAVKTGKLHKIAPKLYTSNFKETPASVVARNCYQILGEFFPSAVISHRSALEGGVHDNAIILTYKYTKKISLPGLQIRLISGHGAAAGDTPFMSELFMASRARALLENLTQSRGHEEIKKNLSRHQIEEMLDKLCRIYGEEELNHLRDQARQLAKILHLEKEFKLLEKIISAMLGSQSIKSLHSENARARAMGKPFDAPRLELFSALFAFLKKEILPLKKQAIHSTQQLHNLAFFEAYFSNYIEGTEFAVDEAADIIFHHKLTPQRPQDAHDITATFQIVANTAEMNKTPKSADELITLLKKRHNILMETRNDKQPGVFKTIANRVGNTIFVLPELMEGTFLKAFSLYENLDPGIARAIFMMFLVSEIHPFLDGNGRIARMMMNAELVHTGECRIIIPTVFREDYLLALRQLSRNNVADGYVRMLLRAQAFTHSFDFSEYQKALQQLTASHAFLEPHEGKLTF